MELKEQPRFEKAGQMRKPISWKSAGIAILLICASAALVCILIFQLYGLLFYLGFITIATLAYAIKTKYWGENIKRWPEEQWEEDQRP